jgi:class 3 adenylate cyclase
MDVGEWLRNIGLPQYEDAFLENAIDDELLRGLTAEDLRELGVAALGHRLKILKAINELPKLAVASADPLAPIPAFGEDAAQRRQLTVVFCDLVGSTALSARLDPEDMRDVVRAYHDACSRAIARHDGFVAKFMGDGVLAYFGYPHAHEDDAERAVRAGLAIIADVGKLETPAKVELTVRVGMATGLVIVGDHIGQGSAREQMVVGDPPNLAARLQALAKPGSVLIAEATRRLIGGSFELKALGPQILKGFDEAVPAWVALREAENISRFDASRSEKMTPFVGRQEEVGRLVELWRYSTAGEGQAVALSGEAGIGKSRITATLRERIGAERHIVLRYQCSQHHANDAFYPIIGQIWHAAGFTSDESSARRLDKLEAMISLSGADAGEIGPYLASLLSIPTGERYPLLEMAPDEVKERTIASLIALFVELAKASPVLALLEDAHWIDPTSLEVFGRLIEKMQSQRVLLVATFRPEFASPWLGPPHVTPISLNRFGRAEAMTMINRVAGGKALPTEVLEQIIAKTDGVPLFVEELTKTVLESGLLREESGSYVLNGALTPLAIPSTLQDSLMARLDRLASVREIAQIGAAIGREFSYRLLEAVSPIKGAALQDALSQLVASELVYGRGAAPDAMYIFKHALVQDTAYSSLLRGPRQRIHAEIGRALGERFADQVESAPAIIAHHYSEAGLAELAARYWLAAAEVAHARAAPVEANRYVDAGLALLPRIPENAEKQSLELALQIANANALLAMQGYNAPQTLAALTAAKQLLDAGVGSDLQRFTVLYGLGAANYVGARMQSALALAHEIVQVADRQDDSTYRLVAYRLLGTVQYLTGCNRQALESLQQAERYRDRDRDRRMSYRFGLDAGLDALNWKLWPLYQLGLLDQWTHVIEQVRAEISDHPHPPTIATCTSFAVCMPEVIMGDLEASEHHSGEMVAYCTENKIEFFKLIAVVHQLGPRAMRNPTKENIAAALAAVDAHHAIGMRLTRPTYLGLIAMAMLSAGDAAGAQELLREAFTLVEDGGETANLSNLHRFDGLVALYRPEPDLAQAEVCFRKAIDVARVQEGLMLELEAACDLARLWRITGSLRDIRGLLEPILAMIVGGETVPIIQNARALLAEVA